MQITTIFAYVLLLLVATDPARVSGQQCECGTPDSNDYIHDCDTIEDALKRRLQTDESEPFKYCQDFNTSAAGCVTQGSLRREPLMMADGGRSGSVYTVNFRNSLNPNVQPSCYRENELCVADVRCNPGEVVFYRIIDHDIEGTSANAVFPTNFFCRERGNAQSSNQCLDYLRVTSPDISSRDEQCTCGRVGVDGQSFENLDINEEDMLFGDVTLSQRSNSNCRGSGALVSVMCITDQLNEILSPVQKRQLQNGSSGSVCRSTFVNSRLLRTRPRVLPFPPFSLSRRLYPRQFTIIIPLGRSFTFTRGVIRDGKKKTLAKGVIFLVQVKELRRKRITRVFKWSAPRRFHGYGRLIVAIRTKPFRKDVFFIDETFPPEFRLSPEEDRVVVSLLTAIARKHAARAPFQRHYGYRSPPILGTARKQHKSLPHKNRLTRTNLNQLSRENLEACQPIVRLAATAFAKLFRVSRKPTTPTRFPPYVRPRFHGFTHRQRGKAIP